MGAVAAAVLALASPASAANLTRIALVVHPVVNVSEVDSKKVALELAAAMRQRYEAEILAGDGVRSKLPSKLAEDCVSDPYCVGQVGDRVGADQLLFLVLVRAGDKIQVDATWAELVSGRTMPRDAFEIGDDSAQRATVLAEMAPLMLPRGTVPLKGAAGAVTKPPADGPDVRPEHRLPEVPGSSPWGTVDSPALGLETAAWASAGVSAVALGVGVAVILGGLADYAEQLEIGCVNQVEPEGRCATIDDRFATRSTVANMLLLGSGLAAATSVALFAAAADAGAEATASVAVSDDGVGLAWGGRF